MRKVVQDALNRAVTNGYSFSGVTPMQIAIDLYDCDADIEAAVEAPEVLLPHVKSWLGEEHG